MKNSAPLRLFAFPLLTAALLAGCGTTTTPAATAASTSALRAQGLDAKYAYVHTLTISSTLTKDSLQSLYGGKVLSFHPEFGNAIVANNISTKQTYDVGVEANTASLNMGEAKAAGYTVWSSGFSAWSSGYSAWSSGYSAWSTGTTAAATTFSENVPAWNAVQLSSAQTLVPELGRGVKVAVLDTGIDLNHNAFQGHLDTARMKDYVDGDLVPQEVNGNLDGTYSDGYGHGTAVAGVILQIAPNATILPIRVLGPTGGGDLQTIASAVDYAVASGAKVINLSLGGTTNSSAVNTSITNAIKAGVPVVVAAGNSGDTNVLYPAVQADATSGTQGPGSAGVGSVTPNFLKSSFSSYGTNLELSAPGESLKTAFPGDATNPGGYTILATGTSFSTPVVSGALALGLSTGLIQASNGGTVATLMTNLDKTATPPSDPSYTAANLGWGTLNIYNFVHLYR